MRMPQNVKKIRFVNKGNGRSGTATRISNADWIGHYDDKPEEQVKLYTPYLRSSYFFDVEFIR